MIRAESWLKERGIKSEQWSGIKIRHAENTPAGPWSSVVIDIQRRNGEWIVTQIDRRFEPLPDGTALLSEL